MDPSPRGSRLDADHPENGVLIPRLFTLNPIEQVFAKLKHLLRKAQERTSERAWDRIGQLLKTFSPEECANYVANSGYRFNAK